MNDEKQQQQQEREEREEKRSQRARDELMLIDTPLPPLEDESVQFELGADDENDEDEDGEEEEQFGEEAANDDEMPEEFDEDEATLRNELDDEGAAQYGDENLQPETSASVFAPPPTRPCRRPNMGILTPAVGFDLDDYDLEKCEPASPLDCGGSSTSSIDYSSAANIRNNTEGVPDDPSQIASTSSSSSAPSSTANFLLPATTRVQN